MLHLIGRQEQTRRKPATQSQWVYRHTRDQDRQAAENEMHEAQSVSPVRHAGRVRCFLGTLVKEPLAWRPR